MTEPLKDFRPELRPQTHKALRRIARARGVKINALGRQIIEEYVEKALHEAKVILGQSDDDPDEPESHGSEPESHGIGRSARR